MRFTRRMLCLLLAVMLVFSVPLVAMAEAPPGASESAEPTEAVVETTSPEETEATEPSTEETETPVEDTPDESEDDHLLDADTYALCCLTLPTTAITPPG